MSLFGLTNKNGILDGAGLGANNKVWNGYQKYQKKLSLPDNSKLIQTESGVTWNHKLVKLCFATLAFEK